MTTLNFYEILTKNLSTESKWFLAMLQQEKESINKEQLWEITNQAYISVEEKKGIVDPSPLISSRYLLDIHSARLEGAGLVQVKELGRMRLYSITPLGKQLLEYISSSRSKQ